MLSDLQRSVPALADYPSEVRSESIHGGTRKGGNLSGRRKAPLVSIVTVVRNAAPTLPRAAQSVLLQDYPEVEYIIVDGKSTDGTLDVIKRLEERLAVWLSEQDLGISDAFNKGIALARGEIVGLLNGDDWYEPGAISAAVNTLKKSGADIAYGKLQYWKGDRKTYLVDGSADLLEKEMTLGHPTVFVRRRCFERIGLFRLDFRQAMDYEWLLRAKVNGLQFTYVDQCLANMQGGGIGDRYWCESQREVARARALHLPHARGSLAYWTYLGLAIGRGTVRRILDALGLGVVRRCYHRYISRVRVEAASD